MGLKDVLFGLTTENAGVGLGAAVFDCALGSTKTLSGTLRELGLVGIDQERFVKIALFEFLFLYDHVVERAASRMLSPSFHDEAMTFLMATQAFRVGELMDASQDEKLRASAAFSQQQNAFNAQFGAYSLMPEGDTEEGTLFHEFAKHLGRPFGADRNAFFVAAVTRCAAEGFVALAPHETLRRVCRSSST